MISNRSKEQNKKMYALFNELGIEQELKQELCLQFSNNRTNKSSELTHLEASRLINSLANLNTKLEHPHKPKLASKSKEYVSKHTKMVNKIFHYCHLLGWELPNGKVDSERLHAWINKYGYKHKPINQYTTEELPLLVSQFEALYLSVTNDKKRNRTTRTRN